MDFVKIASIILIAIGAVVNYGSSIIVKRMDLAAKMKVKEAHELTAEDLEKYKHQKAIVRVKIVGLLLLLPGVILALIAYK